jgi:hypothetical protein
VERTCRFCGTLMRDDDEIVVVGAEPIHAACAAAELSPSGEWQHTAVTTLSQWARAVGWGSST